MSQSSYTISRDESHTTISLSGEWRITSIRSLHEDISKSWNFSPYEKIVLDGKDLTSIDTSGAALIFHTLDKSGICGTEEKSFSENHQTILNLAKENLECTDRIVPCDSIGLVQGVGRSTIGGICHIRDVLKFIGQVVRELFQTSAQPTRIRLKELFVQLESAGLDAIPISALMTFLIGIVITYLFAMQAEQYGANIFVVDFVGVSLCRELAVVIVAIIVAGRSGSAFTAQLGTMKLTEELDALKTLGLSPFRVLVVPRVLALVICMPLLVFVGDVVGIIGGMIVAEVKLGITMHTFIDRLQGVLELNTVLVGLVKAPVFAAFIAMIGCRMGLNVEPNAKSLGQSTTSTVVQCIVAVIILNAAFAILFAELEI